MTNNGFSQNVSCFSFFLPPFKKGAAAPFLIAAKFPSERKKVFNPAIRMYLSYVILTLQISVVLRNLRLCLSYTSSPLMRRGRLRAPSLPVPVPTAVLVIRTRRHFWIFKAKRILFSLTAINQILYQTEVTGNGKETKQSQKIP